MTEIMTEPGDPSDGCTKAADAARRYRQANGQKVRERARERRAVNPEPDRARFRRWYEASRQAVFDHYGTKCACCGSATRLTIDHVNGDGSEHRKEIGAKGSTRMYRWLISNGFPDGFQTLCGSCNRSKGKGERCGLSHTAV